MGIVKIKDFEISKFLNESKHSSFFTQEFILKKSFSCIDWWGFFKGKELICVWPIPITSTGQPTHDYFITYYIGPMWKRPLPDLPEHRSMSVVTSVYNSYMETFQKEYKSVMFDLPLGLIDVRPFIWQHKNNEKIKSSIEIRYTAVLEIVAYEKILKSFRQERRRELLKINKKDFEITFNSHDTAKICDFYKNNIKSLNFSPSRESMLKNFLNMQQEEGVISIQVTSKRNMKIVGFVLMGIFSDTCNVILNLCDTNFKGNKSFLPTFLTDQIIQYACEKGLKTIDFNGANSPGLADSKHSFGAYPQLYFRITTQFGY